MKVSRVRDSNFPEIEKTIIQSLNSLDDPDANVQRAKEEAENTVSEVSKAINSFKNQDKIVFKPKSADDYPQVVIVTAVDYERYSLDGMTKLIQNRVDYAHFQNYGTFVRYSQEFLPQLNAQSFLQTREKAKWVRIYCMQAARFAFPNAKWFWFVDQDSLIMDMSINIEEYMLNEQALDPIMMREQPLVPPSGAIKTYKNVKPNSIKLIVTQSESMIETTSFVLKNDHVGKSILEIWGNPLYLNYQSFPYGPDSAITHILQWHPFVLSKTTIVPARTIAAAHNFKKKDTSDSKFVYTEGDFVVQWGDCKAPACEQILSQYDLLVKKPK
ncbi:putative alpha-16-mannosyltransferase [Spathaspora sp. JA1]|nr:putative alpha-16-mannosyltransferase [Spathaspora sp. JA1]